ncbi:MAG: hypothetical protein CVV49_01570 [Spirochaetae bacterium HGW-Spirochaetae-5]|nr:MAG: hypothetical protein CVV49_01570 [Spirochaetae bacterium HGW-Spirochaetae-5]
MRSKFFSTLCLSVLMFVFSAAGVNAQEVDEFGFNKRSFIIQSALEPNTSIKGFWDLPGKPGKDAGNLKRTKKQDGTKGWLKMQVWQREKGDPADRRFTIYPAHVKGRYYINFSKFFGTQDLWMLCTDETGTKAEGRIGIESWEVKYIGNFKWKIYGASSNTKGKVLCLESRTAKNGTKLVLKPDHNGADAEWVFYDTATNRSFAPVSVKKPEPVLTTPDFFIKNKNFEYSANGNMVYYKAKGTAVVKKIVGDAAFVTINISESESEGPKGIEKKGKRTYEAKFTRKGDTYYMDEEKNGDMAPSGKVDNSGLTLDLSSEGGSNIFKVK